MNNSELIKLYWDEFKYRHQHYWTLFFKFAFVIIFLLAIPFLYQEKLKDFIEYLRFIPFVSGILSICISFLLLSEDNRLRIIHNKYKKLKNEDDINKKYMKKGIGIYVSIMFAAIFISLSIIEYLIIV